MVGLAGCFLDIQGSAEKKLFVLQAEVKFHHIITLSGMFIAIPRSRYYLHAKIQELHDLTISVII